MRKRSVVSALVLGLTVFCSNSGFAVESCAGWARLNFTDQAKYFLYNNIWGVGSITNWTQCIYGNGPTTASFGWRWNWPDGGNPDSVKAYPGSEDERFQLFGSSDADQRQQEHRREMGLLRKRPKRYRLSNREGKRRLGHLGRRNGGGAHTYEIMVWPYYWGYTSHFGTKIATVSIAGHPWNVYYTNAPGWNYYAFKRTSNATSLEFNMRSFFDWLRSQNRINASHWIQTIEAGSEVKFGQGRVDTSSYYATVR
jgi:hypothetical protein